jgi:hypothetical protein
MTNTTAAIAEHDSRRGASSLGDTCAAFDGDVAVSMNAEAQSGHGRLSETVQY